MKRVELLQKPIKELELSEDFKDMALRNDFRNLQDIINWPISVLLMHNDFTYHIIQELREFLKRNDLLNLLKIDNSKSV